jgi:hypothetical protein
MDLAQFSELENLSVRFARFDKGRTKAAKFKDKRSKIGVRFDGSLRYDLAGKDKSALREKVFERDSWFCVDASSELRTGNFVGCRGPLELSHWPPMSKSEGSDEMKTCFTRCRKHHRLLDNNQVKWRKP